MEFNSAESTVMHIDINSCFATIEQQANPFLRGKPVVVAAFTTDKGCILASSIEAKRLGIKTGMRVLDGREIYPKLVVLAPDPWKYRDVHLKLRKIVSDYTDDFSPKSIDEFVLNLKDYLTVKTVSCTSVAQESITRVALEIKERIKSEIGEWITVSIGISTNRYLAKVAAGLHKPDGLDEINAKNFLDVYSTLRLIDLTGIKTGNAARLSSMGIYSVLDFYESPVWKLKSAFHSITGLYWHQRLRGYEVDETSFGRKSYGNSVALGKNLSKISELSPVLARLTEKMCSRLRHAGYVAGGIHIALVFKDGSLWHRGHLMQNSKFDSRDFYHAAFKLLIEANPDKPVLNLAISCFDLNENKSLQLGLFRNELTRSDLVKATDLINEKWGDFTIGSAKSFGGAKIVMDRIAFGGIREL
jgi:DNA polymerase-4